MAADSCSSTAVWLVPAVQWDPLPGRLGQRYRCRTCLRRLCMPWKPAPGALCCNSDARASSTFALTANGTLRREELQISGLENPRWTPHSGDIWDDLCAAQ